MQYFRQIIPRLFSQKYSAFFKEPLVTFFVFAMLVMVADRLSPIWSRVDLTLTGDDVALIHDQEQLLKGEPLTKEEKQRALDSYIRRVILLDEARRLGVDQDPQIENLIFRKYLAMIAAEMPEPTEAQLAEFYGRHIDQFSEGAQWDLRVVVADDPEKYDEKTLEALFDRTRKPVVGEDFKQLLGVDSYYLRRSFGVPFVRSVETAVIGVWQSPVKSSGQVFFFCIDALHPGAPKPLADVRQHVRNAWRKSHEAALVERKVNALKSHYAIEIEGS